LPIGSEAAWRPAGQAALTVERGAAIVDRGQDTSGEDKPPVVVAADETVALPTDASVTLRGSGEDPINLILVSLEEALASR
jgi:hypothetical protein